MTIPNGVPVIVADMLRAAQQALEKAQVTQDERLEGAAVSVLSALTLRLRQRHAILPAEMRKYVDIVLEAKTK